jgi:hypothetical protein
VQRDEPERNVVKWHSTVPTAAWDGDVGGHEKGEILQDNVWPIGIAPEWIDNDSAQILVQDERLQVQFEKGLVQSRL